MIQKIKNCNQNNDIAETISEKGILWIVHTDGRITKQLGNFEEKQPPLMYPYPEDPKGNDIKTLSRWYNRYEMAEQQNYLFAVKWRKEQKRKLQNIRATYRKQQIRQSVKQILQRIFNNSKQR